MRLKLLFCWEKDKENPALIVPNYADEPIIYLIVYGLNIIIIINKRIHAFWHFERNSEKSPSTISQIKKKWFHFIDCLQKKQKQKLLITCVHFFLLKGTQP